MNTTVTLSKSADAPTVNTDWNIIKPRQPARQLQYTFHQHSLLIVQQVAVYPNTRGLNNSLVMHGSLLNIHTMT